MARPFLKMLFLPALALTLSVLTVVFGAVPMLAFRRVYGRMAYWFIQLFLVGVLLFAGVLSYGLIFLATTVLVGLYVEVEESGGTIFNSAAFAFLATAAMILVGLGGWLHLTHGNLFLEVKALVTPFAENMTKLNPGLQLRVDSVVQQLPSGLTIMLMFSLASALLMEGALARWLNLPDNRIPHRARLTGFRVADFMVWILMVAILGTFLKHGIAWAQIAASNLFSVLVVVYFFQGLAVVASAFRSFKVGPGWQAVWYMLIALQLFLVVSFIGLCDYWLEFRERLSMRPVKSK